MNDIKKLPRWAQSHIEKLERNLAYAKQQLEDATGNDSESEVSLVNHLDWGNYKGLPRRSTIRFRTSNGDIRCNVSEGKLVVMSDGSKIYIEPCASNVVHVSVPKRGEM